MSICYNNSMKLLVLFGAPAVGKATVGKLIATQTNFKLFHNHMIMDGVMDLFGVGTSSENRLSKLIRTAVIEEAASSEIDLIFTYVWNFGSGRGKDNISIYKDIYESRGGEVFFVELTAPLATRIERADTIDRREMKAHAPSGERVTQLESALDFHSPKPFYFDNFSQIDTTNKTADDTARRVISIVS